MADLVIVDAGVDQLGLLQSETIHLFRSVIQRVTIAPLAELLSGTLVLKYGLVSHSLLSLLM